MITTVLVIEPLLAFDLVLVTWEPLSGLWGNPLKEYHVVLVVIIIIVDIVWSWSLLSTSR